MGFLKNIFAPMVDNSFVSDAQKTLSVCRSYGPQERAELKVCTLLALATMVSDSQQQGDKTIELVLEAMDVGKKLSDQEIGLLSQFTMKLISMQKRAYRSDSRILNLLSGGVPIWIVSIRALSYVSVLPYARELWSILQDSDSLTVFDEVEAIANLLRGQPVAEVLNRLNSIFSTPNLFVAR